MRHFFWSKSVKFLDTAQEACYNKNYHAQNKNFHMQKPKGVQ